MPMPDTAYYFMICAFCGLSPNYMLDVRMSLWKVPCLRSIEPFLGVNFPWLEGADGGTIFRPVGSCEMSNVPRKGSNLIQF